MKSFPILLACVLALALRPCAMAESGASSAASLPVASASSDKRLEANDRVRITVFEEPELETITTVSQSGNVRFPLIGEVKVGGRTVAEAARIVQERLQERYLVDPQVNISILERARGLVTVLGQVQRPGTFRFPDGQSLDLLQFIGIAGGYSRLADPSRITVIRRSAKGEKVFKLNAKKMARDAGAKPFTVLPGDVITVGERFF